MAHKVVKEVTHPVHGPDGHSLTFAPGDQFPEDRELPPEVPWRLVVAEAPDEPAPELKATAVKAEVKAAAAVKPGGKGA